MNPSSCTFAPTTSILLAAALCAFPQAAWTQATPATPDPASNQSGSLSPVDVTPNPNGRGDGMFIPLTKNQPFKVKFNVEITKPVPGGSLVRQKYFVMAARDSAGYEYREMRDVVPFTSDREPAVVSTMVYDPKNSTSTMCSSARQSCQRRGFNTSLQPAPQPGLGLTENGSTTILRESLGKKQIDGLEAEGIRETQTVKAGTSGNDKPLVTTRETWYSPQLQIYLSVSVTDPYGATRKVEASDLKLGEPGEEWFAIPEGYRILIQRTTGIARSMPTLAQTLKQHISGIGEDQLAQELGPVEEALLNYAKAHAAAAPEDPANKPFNNQDQTSTNDPANSRLLFMLQMRLASEVQILQTTEQRMNRVQIDDAILRMNTAYRAVLASPCMAKPTAGDPPTMPTSTAALEAEQKAWMQLYTSWTGFLKILFPNSPPENAAFMLASERSGELQRMQNVERNRGCRPEESLQAFIERLVPAQTPEQLSASLKPVDAALNGFIRAHVSNQPNDNEANFARMLESRLSADLQMQQHGAAPTREQFEEADLHLNQAFRSVIDSPCIDRHIPGDPPNAPAGGNTLRAEETSWLAMRDAWIKFVASLYPNSPNAGFAYSMTEQRAAELRQIRDIERNRGCRSDD